MKLNVRRAKKKALQAGFYVPFTVYFFAFAVAAGFGYQLLGRQINATSSYSDIFALLLKVAVFFTLVMLSFALVSVLIAFSYFAYRKHHQKVRFAIETNTKEVAPDQKQAVTVSIEPILKPLFGFLRMRLAYDGLQYSPKFELLEQGSKNLVKTAIHGIYYWPLPQIKEYRVEKAIIYFEDIFQFFSFAISLPAKDNFYTQPASRQVNNLAALPRKTEETSTRIEQMRRVEGEYLNYKNFENNDDVRRIVWKIYAKNKDLVVRVPEVMDPYASHMYLYPSFFSKFAFAGNSVLEVPFLNYYKQMLWSVYRNLVMRGFEVKYIAEQDLPVDNETDEQQAVKRRVSTSNWQRNKDLKTFVKLNDAAVVVISSLSDAEQVQSLLDTNNNISFVFIKLTDSLKQQKASDWLQWVFVENEADSLDVYKRNWSLSALRAAVKENEQKLATIMAKYQDASELTLTGKG